MPRSAAGYAAGIDPTPPVGRRNRPCLAALTLAVTVAGGRAGPSPAFHPEPIFAEQLGLKHHCPTLAELADGSLLAAWYYGITHHGESDVGGAILGALRRRGRWGRPFVLYDSYRDAEGNPVLWFDAERQRLHLFTGTMREDPQWDSLTTHWLSAPVARARDVRPRAAWPVVWDQRRTLSQGDWREIDAAAGERGYVLRTRPLELGRRLLLPLYTHGGAGSRVGVMAMDRDTGRWTPPVLLPPGDAEQPALARLRDGSILMLARNTAGPRAWWSRSHDGGKTWDALSLHPALRNENNSLDLASLPDGRLVAVHNTDRTRRELVLSLSRDEGRTWEGRVIERVVEGEVSYPTALMSRDGRTLHLVYGWCRRTIAYAAIPVGSLPR